MALYFICCYPFLEFNAATWGKWEGSMIVVPLKTTPRHDPLNSCRSIDSNVQNALRMKINITDSTGAMLPSNTACHVNSFLDGHLDINMICIDVFMEHCSTSIAHRKKHCWWTPPPHPHPTPTNITTTHDIFNVSITHASIFISPKFAFLSHNA